MNKSIRLPGYDYTQPGAYFITICTHHHQSLFGEIINGEMKLNNFGLIAQHEWQNTISIRENIDADEYIIMPNHFHAILMLNDSLCSGTARCSTTESYSKQIRVRPNSVSAIIRAFKSAVSRQIHFQFDPNIQIWQPDCYEHIIRNEIELDKTRAYIINNPLQWALDNLEPPDWDSL
jgi:REP element-mobilizing transposase RayT